LGTTLAARPLWSEMLDGIAILSGLWFFGTDDKPNYRSTGPNGNYVEKADHDRLARRKKAPVGRKH